MPTPNFLLNDDERLDQYFKEHGVRATKEKENNLSTQQDGMRETVENIQNMYAQNAETGADPGEAFTRVMEEASATLLPAKEDNLNQPPDPHKEQPAEPLEFERAMIQLSLKYKWLSATVMW